jgi:hypothetical protein
MNIGCHRNFQLAANTRKNLAALTHANSAERADRSSVRFVVGGLENKINIFGRTDCRDFFCNAPGELLRLNHARPENECGTFSADRDGSDFQGPGFHELIVGRLCQPPIIFEGVSQKRPTTFCTAQDRQWQMARITREKKVTQLRASLEGKEAANRTENLKLKMLPVYAEGTRN